MSAFDWLLLIGGAIGWFSWWIKADECRDLAADVRAAGRDALRLAAMVEDRDGQIRDLEVCMVMLSAEESRKVAELEAAIEMLHAGSGS